MKKLRLTLNGKIYEVVVEVLEDDEQYVTGGNLPSARTAGGAPRAKAAPAAAPATAPPRPAANNAKGGVDPNTILAPIAGTVQKVFVQAGTHVEEKTPVVLLDAMKMDTYIHAPRSGDVAEVCVAPGDTVQVGTVLLRYRAEG
ncbi:MAG: acetyl-CoA carboxylase biotin carboxyl carrier protein subunit [bacterium]|nr:acetyl-CoA carboxylase biotin carboxyl carrier protein subunit [bacterium]